MRLMLKHADVNFVDNRLQQPEWPALKPNFPPGGLPCWTEKVTNANANIPGGEIKMNESNALARYLAKRFGYHPMNPKQAWDVDATFDFIFGHWGKMATIALMGSQDAAAEETYIGATTAIADKMEKKLCERKTKFISGNKLTVNDFQLAHCMWTYWCNP